MDKKIVAATIVPGRYKDTVHAVFNDGTEDDLFSYFNDELFFSENEFIGKTEDQAHDLFHKKDIAYLRS